MDENDRNENKKSIQDNEIYPNINDNNFINKIYNKLDYVIYEKSDEFSYEKELDIDGLQLLGHQLFVQNFLLT